jgi:hypothetical protein
MDLASREVDFALPLPKNSVQVAELKTRAGPDGSLLSRTATAVSRYATSTQLLPPLPLLRLLFFQTAELRWCMGIPGTSLQYAVVRSSEERACGP